MPQREPQIVELLGRGGEQEIALVAVRIGCAMQFGPGSTGLALDVVAGRHAVGVEVLRRLQQVLELHPLVAADAGHRRRPGQVAVGEFVDHGVAEDVLVVEHVVREAHLLGHAAGVVDVAAGAAGALLGQRRAVVVELQRDADDVVALFGKLGGHDRAVDAARHGHDHARLGRGLGEAQGVQILGAIEGHGGLRSGQARQVRASGGEYRKMRTTNNPAFHRPLSRTRDFRGKCGSGDGPRCISRRFRDQGR